MQEGKGSEGKPGRQGRTGNVWHVSLARQGRVDRAEEFRAGMPGRQCCAGSTEKSGQGRAGRPSMVGKGRTGKTGQVSKAH